MGHHHTSEEASLVTRGTDLICSLIKKLIAEKPVCCVLSLRSGSNIYDSTNAEDAKTFWSLASRITELTKGGGNTKALLVALVVKGELEKIPSATRSLVERDAYIRLTPLTDNIVLEYMSKYLRLPEEKVPEQLHRFVAKITNGNALFIRETMDELLKYGHVVMVKDAKGVPEGLKYTKDLESINIADWSSTAMVGGTICLLESLDPLQAAVIKMATVFRGVFTVADLAASSCSRWAGATYFDAFRVFYSVSVLVDRKIIDRADDVHSKQFLGEDNALECFRLNNVLIRMVGDAMVLEQQKKAVKRQALMERVLAKDLPERMEELQRKKAVHHIPWYYQIDHPEPSKLTKRDM
eukprot:gnl/TRDRNA2_/TRDRNA2_153325_c0_seq1.p1 gnl/TRDRNA2_/TRDRNA2_153325_c0~~gnl/TRDRNA2_/TRDRNA2_153325_c0_seq1.p1  ORF type:complete len:370 (+),score=89.11 gnl/TRDRNA2_/TRDRNA2_153325_c0_seq1:54-1112(+)